MDQTVNVAVVRGQKRRDAVAAALGLIADDVRGRVRPEVLIKPNLVSHRRQLASTHADTLSATLDAVLKLGARRVVVAEGATDAPAGFERFSYHNEAPFRPIRFVDLNREENNWVPMELTTVEGAKQVARVSRSVVDSPCRVSLAVAKTHVTSVVTLSLKNMLSSIHSSDRVMMHGNAGGGNGYSGWKRWAVEFLKGDNLAVDLVTRLIGHVRNERNVWRTTSSQAGRSLESLSAAELAFLKTVEAMNHNLVALARKTKPHIAVVDGFMGMQGEGPRHGTAVPLGTIIAGTDAVAVDAVSAAVMGFDPAEIGYLAYAHAAGLGVADLDRITVIGDPIASVARRFVPHSNFAVQRHWRKLNAPCPPAPHFVFAAKREERITESKQR
jgi:uncharacterized protein (DUF362 family)